MSLEKYRNKRNFKVTSEPEGKNALEKKTPLLYVIQKHAAKHLHYDLRLEMNGVLKSWAIPKGPHLNPSIKRLAVEVEDHPIEYGSFEGTIPAGEYGAGTVMLWDKGEWSPEADPIKSYKKGDITFQIKGKKLKGQWKLIKLKTDNSNSKKHWLFFKMQDLAARKNYDITEDKPLSVQSHKTLIGISKSTSKNIIKKQTKKDIKKK